MIYRLMVYFRSKATGHRRFFSGELAAYAKGLLDFGVECDISRKRRIISTALRYLLQHRYSTLYINVFLKHIFWFCYILVRLSTEKKGIEI